MKGETRLFAKHDGLSLPHLNALIKCVLRKITLKSHSICDS